MTTKIVAPIHGTLPDTLIALSRQAQEQGADYVEVRLDLCAQAGAQLNDIIEHLNNLALPVLATNRHPDEGGAWTDEFGSNDDRLRWLIQAEQAGAAWIDVELAHADHFTTLRSDKKSQLILSHHNFTGMNDDLSTIVQGMLDAGADIAKLALTPADAADLGTLENCYQEFPDHELVIIGMGEVGKPSRLLAGAWGAAFTFATIDSSQESAPGQPSIRELVERYRIHQQGPETRIFGVLGNPVGHSLSPHIHNAAFIEQDIDAVYVPFLATDAGAFWDACGEWIDGLSITIPHKSELQSRMSSLEDLAQSIGAMNTVYRNLEGACLGANTDADAALDCVRQHTGNLAGCRVLVLGAGGVSRAVAFALHAEQAEVTIANRTIERAQNLAAEVGCAAATLDDVKNSDVDQLYHVLVNCTSVGMNSDDSIWPADKHVQDTCVFDTVYTPLETRLLRDAHEAGCQPICGLSMFCLQAAAQYKRWTGMEAPMHVMRRVALEALGHNDNDKYCGPTGDRSDSISL